jgi:hypothetical protein
MDYIFSIDIKVTAKIPWPRLYYWEHEKWDIKFLSVLKNSMCSSSFIVILPLIIVIEI